MLIIGLVIFTKCKRFSQQAIKKKIYFIPRYETKTNLGTEIRKTNLGTEIRKVPYINCTGRALVTLGRA